MLKGNRLSGMVQSHGNMLSCPQYPCNQRLWCPGNPLYNRGEKGSLQLRFADSAHASRSVPQAFTHYNTVFMAASHRSRLRPKDNQTARNPPPDVSSAESCLVRCPGKIPSFIKQTSKLAKLPISLQPSHRPLRQTHSDLR